MTGRRRKAPTRPAPGAAGRPVRLPGRPRPAGRESTGLDRRGAAPGHHLHLQPGGLRGPRSASAWTPGCASPQPDEAAAITEIAEAADQGTSPRPTLPVLGYGEWLTGPAARHRRPPTRGMLPHVSRKWSRSCSKPAWSARSFATETLAPGHQTCRPGRWWSNGWDKWERRDPRGPDSGGVHAAHRQGPAGRGIDVEGHAVVLWQPGMDPLAVAGAGRAPRTYPLKTPSFRPSLQHGGETLVGQGGALDKAAALLESSFAQFQAGPGGWSAIARQGAGRSREGPGRARPVVRPSVTTAGYHALARGTGRPGGGGRPGNARADRRVQARQSLEQLRPGRHNPGPRGPPGRPRGRPGSRPDPASAGPARSPGAAGAAARGGRIRPPAANEPRLPTGPHR